MSHHPPVEYDINENTDSHFGVPTLPKAGNTKKLKNKYSTLPEQKLFSTSSDLQLQQYDALFVLN